MNQGRSAPDRISRRSPRMAPGDLAVALDAIANADVLPWGRDRFCAETGIRTDRMLDWLRGDDSVPPQTRALVIALQSPDARARLYAANHAAQRQEKAYVSQRK